jgi:hypothetical protein
VSPEFRKPVHFDFGQAFERIVHDLRKWGIHTRLIDRRRRLAAKSGQKDGKFETELVRVLDSQPPFQFDIVGDWGHALVAVIETFIQIIVTGNGSRRGVALTAKGEEKRDHVLRVAVLPLLHVRFYPGLDRFLSV